jgi:hypothetical protein
VVDGCQLIEKRDQRRETREERPEKRNQRRETREAREERPEKREEKPEKREKRGQMIDARSLSFRYSATERSRSARCTVTEHVKVPLTNARPLSEAEALPINISEFLGLKPKVTI